MAEEECPFCSFSSSVITVIGRRRRKRTNSPSLLFYCLPHISLQKIGGHWWKKTKKTKEAFLSVWANDGRAEGNNKRIFSVRRVIISQTQKKAINTQSPPFPFNGSELQAPTNLPQRKEKKETIMGDVRGGNCKVGE